MDFSFAMNLSVNSVPSVRDKRVNSSRSLEAHREFFVNRVLYLNRAV